MKLAKSTMVLLVVMFIFLLTFTIAFPTFRGEDLSLDGRIQFALGSIIENTATNLLTITNDVNITGNISVNQLIVRNPSSIFLGGPDFAIFSASELTGNISGENFSRITTTINTDFISLASSNFTQIMATINLNNRGNASSAVSAVNNLFHGIGFLKFNLNHTSDPEGGQIGNNFGNFTFFNRNDGNNTYKFSFFDDVIRLDDGSNVGVVNETIVIEIHNALYSNPFLTTFNYDVNILGNLDLEGNFTGRQYYGNMYLYEPLTPTTISIALINIPYNITGLSTTENNGFTFSSDTLIVNKAGLYETRLSISYTDSTNNRHAFSVLINGVQQEHISCIASVTNSNNVESTSCGGNLRVVEDDIVTISAMDISGAANDVNIFSTQINLLRIDN